jgi:hypothetical protein
MKNYTNLQTIVISISNQNLKEEFEVFYQLFLSGKAKVGTAEVYIL